MVFYKSLLPTELWFKIYKIEHNIKLNKVNSEIKKINLEKIRITDGIICNVKKGGYLFENLLFFMNNKTYSYQNFDSIMIIKSKILNSNNEINIWDFDKYFFMKKQNIKNREGNRRLNELKCI